MSRVAEDDFAALQQNWMVVGRVGRESRFHRQRPKRRADMIESGPFNHSKAGVSGRKPADQRDKSRPEKQHACCCALRERPAPNDVSPQKWQNKKVAPHHKLEIVPIPWGGLNKIAED